MTIYSVRPAGMRNFLIEGNTVEEAVKNNFEYISDTCLSGVGINPGLALEKAWLTKQWNHTTVLHATTYGNESMIGYNPDVLQDFCVAIDELPEGEVPEDTEILLNEQLDSNPMTCQFLEVGKTLGIFKGLADYIAINYGNCEMEILPTEIVDGHFPNLMRNATQGYLSRVALEVSRSCPKRNRDVEDLMARMEEAQNALALVNTVNTVQQGISTSWYFKTMRWLGTQNQITALAALRQEAGLTQQQMAEIAGVSKRQISAYENPQCSVLGKARHSVIEKMADALNVSCEDLVKHGKAVMVDGKK